MNRRTTLTLISTGLLFLAANIGLAQTNPQIGTWKLNIAKSKIAGPPPRSLILTFSGEGDTLTNTAESIDAQGQASKTLFMHIYDGKPHPTPTTGAAAALYDTSTYTRMNINTINFVRTKDGKTVQTGSIVVSSDGKTYTVTTEGVGLNGQQSNEVLVFDRQ